MPVPWHFPTLCELFYAHRYFICDLVKRRTRTAFIWENVANRGSGVGMWPMSNKMSKYEEFIYDTRKSKDEEFVFDTGMNDVIPLDLRPLAEDRSFLGPLTFN